MCAKIIAEQVPPEYQESNWWMYKENFERQTGLITDLQYVEMISIRIIRQIPLTILRKTQMIGTMIGMTCTTQKIVGDTNHLK